MKVTKIEPSYTLHDLTPYEVNLLVNALSVYANEMVSKGFSNSCTQIRELKNIILGATA
jgi:hypothetical protein